MQETIKEKISVISRFDRSTGVFMPAQLKWQGKTRIITALGFHYTLRQGRKLVHIFSVTDRLLCYYLSFDTETLHWTLIEISDGNN